MDQENMDDRVEVNCNGLIVRVTTKIRTLIYKCRNLHNRLARTFNHIGFLRRCLKNDIVPKGLRPTIADVPNKKKLQHKFGKTVVQEQIQGLFGKKRRDMGEERRISWELQQTLEPRVWSIVWIWILVCERQVFNNIKDKQIRKFEALLEECSMQRKKETSGNKCKVYNLSSRNLNVEEKELLKKGLNFVPVCNKSLTPDIVANVERAARRMGGKGPLLVDYTKSYLNGQKNFNCKDNLTALERKALYSLKEDKEIVITNADKGKGVVILDKYDYHNKMIQALDPKDYRKLDTDPTTKKESDLKKDLDKLKSGGFLEDKQVQKIVKCNSNVPTVYGCPKIHKPGVPLRLIVSTVGTPWSELARFLLDIIRPLSYPEGHIVLRNTHELVNQIKAYKISKPCILVSLDIVNLFGSVPVNQCLPIVRNLLNEDLSLHLRTLLPIDTIMELLTTCLDATYFKFEEDFFQQVGGLAMGSPLSPALANIFMNEFHEKMSDLDLYKFVDYLKRYVDDYILIWTGDEIALEEFVSETNKINNNIKFTVEVESNGCLPFLDVLLTKTSEGISVTMYQKPISSGILLNYQSDHPDHVKRNMIVNLGTKVRMCSDDQENDLTKLKTSLRENDYPIKVIDQTLKSKQTKPGKKLKEKGPAVVIPFIGNKGKSFKKKTEKLGIRAIFKRNRNVGEILGKKGKTSGSRNVGVIYKIKCECGKMYIGETGRHINVRINEHKLKVKNKDSCNGIAKHVMETDHTILFDQVEIIDREINLERRKIREAYWIKKLQPELNLNGGVTINDLW